MMRGVFQRALTLRGSKRSAGFTIIETMVVLTVTGALFVVIAATLAGRQNEAEFLHAVQSVQSQTQQIIDQVADGYYPSQNNFSCSASGSSVSFSSVAASQGTNDPCVFLGKVIQFHIAGTGTGSLPEAYQVYTIAGLRSATTGTGSPFQSAGATVVGNIDGNGDYTSYSDANQLEYGLTTKWVKVNGTATVGAVGFLMEPGDFGTSNGYNSGAQPVDLVPIPGTSVSPPQTIPVAVGIINTQLADPNLTADAPINPQPGGVQVCLVSAGTNESAIMTIGNAGRQLLVKLDIKSNASCV